MAEVTLLRHGQASFGADDYDRLSNIGHRQSLWLGEHFKKIDQGFDRIVIGTMRRHQETAKGILKGLGYDLPLLTSPRLNEYDFNGLLVPFKEQYPERWVASDHPRRDYYHNMKSALTCWMRGDIATDGQDSWQSFNARIKEGFEFACNCDAKRTLIVSSGGPIAVIIASILELQSDQTNNLILQIKNSSYSKLLFRSDEAFSDGFNLKAFALDNFNCVSHLETEDKRHSITFS